MAGPGPPRRLWVVTHVVRPYTTCSYSISSNDRSGTPAKAARFDSSLKRRPSANQLDLRPGTPARRTLVHWPRLRLSTHPRSPADDQIPGRVHQVIVTLNDLARALVIAVILPELPKPVRQAGHDLQLA